MLTTLSAEVIGNLFPTPAEAFADPFSFSPTLLLPFLQVAPHCVVGFWSLLIGVPSFSGFWLFAPLCLLYVHQVLLFISPAWECCPTVAVCVSIGLISHFPVFHFHYPFSNGVIFSTLKHTDLHTVRGRSPQKDDVCNEHIFRNGSFRELNNNNNNELYLHGHKRDLKHCKSILTITITKSKSNSDIKLLIINCLAFLNGMLRIVLTAY